MSARTSQLDDVLNQLCDADSLWGPLVFLRPAREERFGSARLLAACGLFGFFYGMCANAVFALTYHMGGRPVPPVYAAPLFLTLAAFACGHLAFVGAWNRRALQLSRRMAWVEANQPRSSRE